jgi:hypothetical protein
LGGDTPKWTDRIIYQLNMMTDFLKVAFAKGITIQDNLINPIKTVQVIAGATPASDATQFSVALPAGYQPQGLQIINCIDLSGAIVGNAVWAEMIPGLQSGNVAVRAIYGLTSGHKYQITFLVY